MKKKERKHEDVDADTSDIGGEVDETETEDIYDEKERDRMLEEDEITEAEEGFMEGTEKAEGKSRQMPQKKHRDTTSVKLAEEEYRED
jgi:hypothetical protein